MSDLHFCGKVYLVLFTVSVLLSSCETATTRPAATMILRNSQYYLALESDYDLGDRKGLFYGIDGEVIYRGSSTFKGKASIEGSAKLLDGRVLNYSTRVGNEIRWEVTDAPYGLGVRCPLIALRSAAVDPEMIALNSIIYISETKGMLLAEGARHDGIWYAMDIGGAIKGKSIDLFTGAGIKSMDALSAWGVEHMDEVSVRVIGQFEGCPAR